MGTPLGPKYIPYTYMDPLGKQSSASSATIREQCRAFHPDSNWNLGDCQNYGPFLGPYYNTGPNTGPNLGDPKRDHNFDNPPFATSPKLVADAQW